MAPRKAAPSARPSYDPDRFYAVDLARPVAWRGDTLCPGRLLEIRGQILTAIIEDDPEAVGDARPL